MKKNSFQLINLISSIIIEMSSAWLKFEPYRYKRVNDRPVSMRIMKTSEWSSFSHFNILCNLISKATVACQSLIQ